MAFRRAGTGHPPGPIGSPGMRPMLAVAIPTYHRPDQLEKCVSTIIDSIEKASAAGGTIREASNVSIVIADDSADDTNVAVIGALRARYALIEHHRNPTNLGIDANIIESVHRCSARYAWIVGEDDRMLASGISVVLGRLLGDVADAPLLFVNYRQVDETTTIVTDPAVLRTALPSRIDAATALARLGWTVGFIGAFVVDTDRFRAIDSAPYVGSYYAHVGTVFEASAGCQIAVEMAPQVDNRCGGSAHFTWSNAALSVMVGFSTMLDVLGQQAGNAYPNTVRAAAAAAFDRRLGWYRPVGLASLRADGHYDLQAFRSIIAVYPGITRMNRLAAQLIAVLPVAAMRVLKRSAVFVRDLQRKVSASRLGARA